MSKLIPMSPKEASTVLFNLRSRRPQILSEAERLTRQIEQLKLTPEQVLKLVSKQKEITDET